MLEDCNGVDDDCDGDVDNGIVWGTAACPATSCRNLLALTPGSGDGFYWLADGLDAYEAECDMTTDGGGWTVMTDELLSGRDWTAFASFGDGVSSGEWDTQGLSLSPRPHWDSDVCTAGVLRATVSLPFTFTEWSGVWSATSTGPVTGANDMVGTGWGESSSATGWESCGGHLKFGTDNITDKAGGEWGAAWDTVSPTRLWSLDAAEFGPTSSVRWEAADGNYAGYPITVSIHDIAIAVR